MKRLGRRLASIIDGLSYVSGGVAAICLVAAAFLVTEGIVARKVFGVSTIWQIEASIFLLIFAVFVGAAFVQKKEHHLNVDLVLVYLPPRARAIVVIIVSILTCLLVAILAWFSWPMWWEAVVTKEHSESLWSPPMWIPYFFLPFGMTLLFLQYVVYIGRKIKALQRGEVATEAERAEIRDLEIPGAGQQPDE